MDQEKELKDLQQKVSEIQNSKSNSEACWLIAKVWEWFESLPEDSKTEELQKYLSGVGDETHKRIQKENYDQLEKRIAELEALENPTQDELKEKVRLMWASSHWYR